MFTGLVEEVGTVKYVLKSSKSAKISIEAKKILEDVKLGDSISTNGVCLTVTEFANNSFTVDVMPETIRHSNLRNIKIGSKVNLERALRVGDRLGGHLVSGHIDGVGIITEYKVEENATWVSIKAPSELLKYIIKKGSVALDGTSLTVAYVDDEIFKVSIIPLTKEETTILSKKTGEEINIECDMVGKYIEKFTMYNEKETKKGIDINFLRNNGFL